MEQKEIKEIIEKFRRMSNQELKYGAEKCADFDRIADQIEEEIYTYEDDIFETEEDIINNVKETFDQIDNFYDREDYENMDML